MRSRWPLLLLMGAFLVSTACNLVLLNALRRAVESGERLLSALDGLTKANAELLGSQDALREQVNICLGHGSRRASLRFLRGS